MLEILGTSYIQYRAPPWNLCKGYLNLEVDKILGRGDGWLVGGSSVVRGRDLTQDLRRGRHRRCEQPSAGIPPDIRRSVS